MHRAIYTDLPKAGTLISHDPFSQPDLYENDVRFKNVCCAADRWDEFLEHRPINKGDNYVEPSISEWKKEAYIGHLAPYNFSIGKE